MIGVAGFEGALSEWMQRTGAAAYAVIDGDGRILAGSLPAGVRPEFFGVMGATMFGAASAASAELGAPIPTCVDVAMDGRRLVVVPFGAGAVLCAVVADSATPTSVVEAASRFGPRGDGGRSLRLPA